MCTYFSVTSEGNYCFLHKFEVVNKFAVSLVFILYSGLRLTESLLPSALLFTVITPHFVWPTALKTVALWLRKTKTFKHKKAKILDLTILDGFPQMQTWDWFAPCKYHLQNTQRVRSKGWRAPETKGRRTLEKDHCNPGCKGSRGPGIYYEQ